MLHHLNRPSPTSTQECRRWLTACGSQPVLRSAAGTMLSDAAIVSSHRHTARRVIFPNYPGCRIAPSDASDNYYYEKWKMASGKFATAISTHFSDVCGLTIGFRGAKELLGRCAILADGTMMSRLDRPRIYAGVGRVGTEASLCGAHTRQMP